MAESLKWWQRAVFYQVYPRSFADGNGDGIGDLPGLIAKLDYLAWLGVDAIWLSPHYPSPQVDVGYDVADYTGVDPDYGTLDDFRTLIDEAHRRGIRLILDLVINHTSDRHAWFRDSRRTLDDPKRDWYIWREGRDGGPPNNWQSVFGGSAWEYDALTGQFYYHFFFKEQPDLNWRNPEVQRAIFDVVRFWYGLGVDGFRIDAIGTLFEDPTLTDHSEPLSQLELHRLARHAATQDARDAVWKRFDRMFEHQSDQPGIHDVFRELRRVNDEFPERLLVGETDEPEYLGSGDELHLVFNFPLMRQPPLTPGKIRRNQRKRHAALPAGAWPCNTLGNHDVGRVYDNFGDGEHDDARARLSLALMLTLRGTPFLYNGEEIGMRDLALDDPSLFRDTLAVWRYNLEREVLQTPHDEALRIAAEAGRDKCRTPMQWDDAPHAGFCPAVVRPWLPVNPNYSTGVNVAGQSAEPGSLLNFYRAFIRLRRDNPALVEGAYRPLHEEAEGYLAFLRESPAQTLLVLLNFSGLRHEARFDLPALDVLYSSAGKSGPVGADLTLEPWEILLCEVGA